MSEANERARRCCSRAEPDLSRNSLVPSTGDLRNPRETWPNLGAEAGSPPIPALIVVKESLPPRAAKIRGPPKGRPCGSEIEGKSALRLIAVRRWPVAALGHELVELGLVLRQAKAFEEFTELALLVFKTP